MESGELGSLITSRTVRAFDRMCTCPLACAKPYTTNSYCHKEIHKIKRRRNPSAFLIIAYPACFEKKEIRSEVYVKAMRELKAIVLKVNKWFHTGTKIQILQNLQIVHQSEDHQLPLLL